MAQQQVLVTGGCGYIGSHVVRHLTEAKASVVVLDNLSTGFADALLHGERLYRGDVGDQALLNQIFAAHKFDVILHFAAKVRVGESVEQPYSYYSNNTFDTLQLIDAATRHGVKHFVFSSTAAVYGQPLSMPVGESAPLKPESPYGASKAMSERILQDISAATGLRHVILRYFNVAGADPAGRIGQRTPDASHLIKAACETAVGARSGFSIFGTDYPTRDGTCVRDYIHIEDLAAAHVQALRYLVSGGENVVLNCGYGHGSSVREVIAAVQAVSGVRFAVKEGPRRPGDVAEVIAATGEIKRRLDWRPQFDDLATIVAHAYAWEQKLRQRA